LSHNQQNIASKVMQPILYDSLCGHDHLLYFSPTFPFERFEFGYLRVPVSSLNNGNSGNITLQSLTWPSFVDSLDQHYCKERDDMPTSVEVSLPEKVSMIL
jgi:hypothetical protein